MTGNNAEARSASPMACQAVMSHHSFSAVGHPRKLGHQPPQTSSTHLWSSVTKATPCPFVPQWSLIPSLHIDYKGTSIVASQGGASFRNRKPPPTRPSSSTSLRQEPAQLGRAPAPAFKPADFNPALSRVASQRSSALHFADPQVQIRWRLCCCSNYFPQVFRIAISAHNSHLCSATRRETSLRGKWPIQLRRFAHLASGTSGCALL